MYELSAIGKKDDNYTQRFRDLRKNKSYEEILSKKPKNDFEAETQDLVRMELADRKIPLKFKDFKKMPKEDQSRRIKDYVGDYHKVKAKTPEFQRVLDELDRDRAIAEIRYGGFGKVPMSVLKNIEKKTVEELSGVVLRELGYKDTMSNREWIKKQKLID